MPALPWFLSYLRPLGGPFTADLRMELASTELISADKIPTSPSDAALCAKEAAAGGMSGVSVPAASGKDHACDKSDPGAQGGIPRGVHLIVKIRSSLLGGQCIKDMAVHMQVFWGF